MSKEEIQHWIDRWIGLNSSYKRDMVINQREMNEQEKATKILFALMVFTICTLALSVLALMYVYAHPTISLK